MSASVDPSDKCFRCTGCGRWIRPSILGMCQCWWLCYHCGAEVAQDIIEKITRKSPAKETPSVR